MYLIYNITCTSLCAPVGTNALTAFHSHLVYMCIGGKSRKAGGHLPPQNCLVGALPSQKFAAVIDSHTNKLVHAQGTMWDCSSCGNVTNSFMKQATTYTLSRYHVS